MTTNETKRPLWSASFRVRVSAQTYEETKQLARKREATISQVARLALVRYLEEQAR